MTQTALPTARRTAILRGIVHVHIVGAENTLCGVRLLGATARPDSPGTEAALYEEMSTTNAISSQLVVDVGRASTCDRCAGHTFETVPGVWAKVQPIGPDNLDTIGGLPESTAGF